MSTKTLNEVRREHERKASELEIYVCDRHGTHEHLVCQPCYAEQQARVELESAALRLDETTEKQRAWVLAELAKRNGGNGHHA